MTNLSEDHAETATYDWQWPFVGGTPVSQGLDSEIFDSVRVPHSQTFVREAIQNSLDARISGDRPVTISFNTFEDGIGNRSRILKDVMRKREHCNLKTPDLWNENRIRWMVVEDSNTKGLHGDISSRTSDFWNYWLNFGISNKDGTGRGGRGIGRVTFLLGSQIHSVIGVTRRLGYREIIACGMSVLKALPEDNRYRSTHAYLAHRENQSIYDLYDDTAFTRLLIDEFRLQDYRSDNHKSGLSLVIPYPYPELTDQNLLAAAIEDFSPAILNNKLIVQVNGKTLDGSSIRQVALNVRDFFRSPALRQDPLRLTDLCEIALGQPEFTISVDTPRDKLTADTYQEERKKIHERFREKQRVHFAVDVPVLKNGKTTRSPLAIAVSAGPPGQPPLDAFFREGMCLPEVNSNNPGELDLVILSEKGELATYLNFCEGKAHLDLLESNEVKEKLREKGYDNYSAPHERRFVKRLPNEVRLFVLPDSTEPDASVFEKFFAAPDGGPQKGKPKKRKPGPVPPIPEPKIPPFLVRELQDGFEVSANPKFELWPLTVRVDIAYDDGSRRPAWSPYDFKLSELDISISGASDKNTDRNRITCKGCDNSFALKVAGFDTRRELVTSVRAFRNA